MDETTPLRCDRVGLLLSLRVDGEATPAQRDEIEAHLPACAACRAAAAVDEAVRARLSEPAAVPSGFVERVLAAAQRTRREARAQNRMLLVGAAAAVIVAIASVASFAPRPDAGRRGAGPTATARARAARALSINLAQYRAEDR